MHSRSVVFALACTTAVRSAPAPEPQLSGLSGLLGGGSSGGLASLAGLFGGAPKASGGAPKASGGAPKGSGGLAGLAGLFGGGAPKSGGGASGLGALAGLFGGSGGSSGLGALSGLLGGSGGNMTSLLSGLSGLVSGNGPDLTFLSMFFDVPGIESLVQGIGLGVLAPIFEMPNIKTYVNSYLNMTDLSKFPFIAPMDNGPAPQGCAEYEMLIARGTGELGPYGFVVGDPLLERVQKDMPSVRGYAVQYPANAQPISWETGKQDVIKRLNTMSESCPEMKFAIVGYSQGSMVMHTAMADSKLSPDALSKVVAGAMFGDPTGRPDSTKETTTAPVKGPMGGMVPPFPAGLKDKVVINCAEGDPICTRGSMNIVMHLTYNNPGTPFMDRSTALIEAAFKGEPLPTISN